MLDHSVHSIGKQPWAIGTMAIPAAAGRAIAELLDSSITLLTMINGVGYNGSTS